MSPSFASFRNPVDSGGPSLLLLRCRGRRDAVNTDGHERTKVNTSLFLIKVKIKVKQEEQLRFHEVNLGNVE